MSGAAVGTRLQPIADRPAYADVRSSRAHTSHGVARHQLPAVAKHTQCLQSSLRAPAWTCSERAFAVLGRHIRPAATPSNSCQQPDQALMCPYALQQRAEPWTHLQVTGRCLGRCSTLNLSSKPQHLRHQRLQLAAQRRGRAGQQALLLHRHGQLRGRPLGAGSGAWSAPAAPPAAPASALAGRPTAQRGGRRQLDSTSRVPTKTGCTHADNPALPMHSHTHG